MCFSHHFLDTNVGLLCSERGLLRCDLQISPREQRAESVVEELERTCKACAVWSSYAPDEDGGGGVGGGGGVESAYVFGEYTVD